MREEMIGRGRERGMNGFRNALGNMMRIANKGIRLWREGDSEGSI